jgi:hypothetical protein
MLKVQGFLSRKEVRDGDIISYPEGAVSIVVQVTSKDFSILQSNKFFHTVQKGGSDLTYYGNLFEMQKETKHEYLISKNLIKQTRHSIEDLIKIDSDTAKIIIETREPIGLFYLKESSIFNDSGEIWIGIDNSEGNAWTEDFKTKQECLDWLVW